MSVPVADDFTAIAKRRAEIAAGDDAPAEGRKLAGHACVLAGGTLTGPLHVPGWGEAAYRDDRCPERACDYCHGLYRGPAIYCSLACAMADA